MLGPRYKYDGVPLLHLNEVQQRARMQVEAKVNSGEYRFIETACPVCDCTVFDSLAEKDRYGLYLPVVICTTCGLIQSNPHMDRESYIAFYNHEYRPLYVGVESATERFFAEQREQGKAIFRFLASRNALKDPAKTFVLEIGCGAGGILQYFAEIGCRVKGVDPGGEYVEFGRERHGLDLSVGTIHDVDPDDAPDLILYSHVLEHITNPNDELRKVHDLLSDTGLLYVAIPGVMNLEHSYETDFLRLLQNAHIFHFTLTSLRQLLVRNQFTLVAGNEVVQSIFAKAPPGAAPPAFVNEYQPALAYLRRVERIRWRNSLPPYRAIRALKKRLVRIFRGIHA